MSNHPTEYELSSEATIEAVVEALGNRLSLSPPERVREKRIYADSFDHRVFRYGGSLWWKDDKSGITLYWRASPTQANQATTIQSWHLDSPPTLISALPEGDLKATLEPILQMRRLLPLLEIHLDDQVYRILDRRRKTVAYLRCRQHRVTGPKRSLEKGAETTRVAPRFTVEPVRGYGKKELEVVKHLEELGLREARTSAFQLALKAVGITLGMNSSKLKFELEPEQPAAVALRQIFLQLLETMQLNESGTRADLDSEFLHDFRVSVRRTRAAITQVRGVLPQRVVERFRTEFSWLGKVTGPTRDLDVYLLKMPGYQQDLPLSISGDLEPLQAFLTARQSQEQRKLARILTSKRYRDLKQSWRDELESPQESDETPPNSLRPISEVARKRIWKAYRKVYTRGSAIQPETPAQALHDLRIDCKKLRYLLEFFRSLFEAKSIDRFIRSLKKLQDTLGDFNDFEVQREQLALFAEEMTAKGSAPSSTLLAMGRLMSLLEEQQDQERKRFHPRFDTFAKTQPVARHLFRAGREG